MKQKEKKKKQKKQRIFVQFSQFLFFSKFVHETLKCMYGFSLEKLCVYGQYNPKRTRQGHNQENNTMKYKQDAFKKSNMHCHFKDTS